MTDKRTASPDWCHTNITDCVLTLYVFLDISLNNTHLHYIWQMLLSRVTYSKGHSPEVNRWVPYHRKTTSLLHGWESNQQPSDYLPDSLTAHRSAITHLLAQSKFSFNCLFTIIKNLFSTVSVYALV